MKYNTKIERYMVTDVLNILNIDLDKLENKIDDEVIKQILIFGAKISEGKYSENYDEVKEEFKKQVQNFANCNKYKAKYFNLLIFIKD